MATTTMTSTTVTKDNPAPELDLVGGALEINSSKRYGLAQESGRADYDRAIDIIKSRLPQMGEVGSRLLISLGDEYSKILIDATTSTPSLEIAGEASTKSDTHIITSPQMIKRLYDGNLIELASFWSEMDLRPATDIWDL